MHHSNNFQRFYSGTGNYSGKLGDRGSTGKSCEMAVKLKQLY